MGKFYVIHALHQFYEPLQTLLDEDACQIQKQIAGKINVGRKKNFLWFTSSQERSRSKEKKCHTITKRLSLRHDRSYLIVTNEGKWILFEALQKHKMIQQSRLQD